MITFPCDKCNGKEWYMYDENHATRCEVCCDHSQGYFQLTENHGAVNAGKWCCRKGCGRILKDTIDGVLFNG